MFKTNGLMWFYPPFGWHGVLERLHHLIFQQIQIVHTRLWHPVMMVHNTVWPCHIYIHPHTCERSEI